MNKAKISLFDKLTCGSPQYAKLETVYEYAVIACGREGVLSWTNRRYQSLIN
jgi:hypothetical protein